MARNRLIAFIVTVCVLGYSLTPAALVPCCCKDLSAMAAQTKASACCQSVKPVKACCADRQHMAACADDTVCKKGPRRCRCLEQIATVAIASTQTESTITRPAPDLTTSNYTVGSRQPVADRVAFAAHPRSNPLSILHKTCNLVC